MLSIFTRELGLVRASAQGIRLEKSKLRYYTQELSVAEFSFVRGKEFWRLTSADRGQVASDKWQVEKTQNTLSQEMTARIALILRRLLHGEEPHQELFDHIQSALEVVGGIDDSTSSEVLQTLESIIIYRIVNLLGYVNAGKEMNARAMSDPLSVQLAQELVSQRPALNVHINKALRESQL